MKTLLKVICNFSWYDTIDRRRLFRPMSCSPGVLSPGLRVDLPGVWSRFPPSLFLLDLRKKRKKSSSRIFLIDLIRSLTQKSCVNIPHSKKSAHKHKYKCGLLVQAKWLHTAGEMTLGLGKMTPGEQDIERNHRLLAPVVRKPIKITRG